MEYFSKFKEVKSELRYGEQQTHHTLSVVIPTYNKPESLKRAVKSAINQEKAGIDYNIVIVENYEGDVSDTINMLSALENPNNIQIVYYQNEKNIGMQANWNRCFEMANADYALMVHTDDYLLPFCLSYVKNSIKQNIQFLTINRYSYIVGDRKTEEEISQAKNSTVEIIIEKNIKFHQQKPIDIILGVVPVAPTGFLACKHTFVSRGGFCTKCHTWPADLELSFELVNRGELYFCQQKLIVKTEGDGNDGTNITSTLPLIHSIREVLVENTHIVYPLSKVVINMRLASISRSFKLAYDSQIKDLFPRIYLNRYFKGLYARIRQFYWNRLLAR